MTARQPVRVRLYEAALDLYDGIQRPKALDVLIYRSASYIAPSGQRHLGGLVLAEQRAYEIVPRADLAYRIIIHHYRIYRTSVDAYRITVDVLYFCTYLAYRLQKCACITDIRDVSHDHILICHDSRRQYTQRRVLRAAYMHLAAQRIAAPHHITSHIPPWLT